MSLDGISDITRRCGPPCAADAPLMTPLDEFMRKIGQQFAIDTRTERTLKIRGTFASRRRHHS